MKKVTGGVNNVDSNKGFHNTGNSNTGDYNSGNCNSGNSNIGDHNTGSFNTGNSNTGFHNTGNYNTGDSNTGDSNMGNCNTGNCNSGSRNNGDCNSGCWNFCDDSCGYFNTKTHEEMMFFNKPHAKKLKGTTFPRFLYFIPLGLSYQEAFQKSWENRGPEEQKQLEKIPNFDWKVFSEISGITPP